MITEDKEKDILIENIDVISNISCSNCGYTGTKHTDDYYAADEFFGEGWRATINRNIYCPKCSKNKLKPRKY